MTTNPLTEAGAAATGTVFNWTWDASLSLPQQVQGPPEDFLLRIHNTVATREQAVRFCAAAEVNSELKQEMAKFLACVQTPAPVLECAGENFPALRGFVFVVLKAGVERQAGDWNPQVVIDELNHWDTFASE